MSGYAYAHRGLWRPDGPPENSLTAYRDSAKAGLGIEFDVRLSADGVPVCFHDATLGRLTRENGQVSDRTAAELTKLRLNASEESIPTLADVLSEWPQHLPLLTEIKAMDTPPEPVAEAVSAALKSYPGAAAAMSFNPKAVARLSPSLQRGLLIDLVERTGPNAFDRQMELAKDLGVDYLSVWHTDAPRAAPFARRFGLGIVVWTVRSEAESLAVHPFADAQIFEGFDPALVAKG